MEYYGVARCSKPNCQFGGYFRRNGRIYCGVHSKTKVNKVAGSCSICQEEALYKGGGEYYCTKHAQREKLPKPPKEELELALSDRQKELDRLAEENRKVGGRGMVYCTKLKMMKKIDHREDALSVFPNYKHGNRKDGLGLPELSPKSIGPINHPQPDLPPALNLENFHQFNKVFPDEIVGGVIASSFFETQRKGYLDPEPHRHKENATGNVPVCSLWKLPDGTLKRLTYFESRQFYCTYYQRAVLQMESFKRLVKLLDDGYNLNIIGYDGYSVEQDLESCYLDISKPFGHELVLYTLLVANEKDYPWIKYTTEKF